MAKFVENTEVTFRLILQKPTAGADYGLQKGHGSSYETIQTQRSAGRDLKFEFDVKVKSGKTGTPDFAGPFVQGPAGERYIYIDIGTYAGQKNTHWSRRLKIPLSGITWDTINSNSVLTARVPGGNDGGPTCGYLWRKVVGASWGWEPGKKR